MIELYDKEQLPPEKKAMLQAGWLPGLYDFKWNDIDILLSDGSKSLIAADILEDYPMADVRSLFVADSSSYATEGKLLLEALEQELAKKEIKLLTAVYPAKKAASLDQLLKSCQWEGPKVVMIECAFESLTFHPSWLYLDFKLPKGFSYFPWHQLTQAEKEDITQRWEKRSLSNDIYPFFEPVSFLENSLGLRHEGRVVGWSLAESPESGVLRYRILYIDPAYRATGIAIQLLAASIHKQDRKRYPLTLFKVNLMHSPLRWLRFVRRRLVPYSQNVTEYIQMWHKII